MENVHAWILNGPNLNLLGVREPEIYGHQSMADILEQIQAEFPNDRVSYFQTNHEGEMIEKIQTWVHPVGLGDDQQVPNFILLNAGAWSHTSVAIADAVAMLKIPVFEVHLSHPPARESFRRVSPLSGYCHGYVSGFGAESYRMAYRGARARCGYGLFPTH
ncbi:MAG: type II 3-dehydroquinate dehydratase [Bacteroidota bacterium]